MGRWFSVNFVAIFSIDMATNSDKSEMLFACTNCHRRCKFEDLSASQQLCKVNN